MLFLIYINDLPIYLNEIASVLFADDTTLISSGTDIQAAIIKLKSETKNLLVWCDYNRLSINWSKTYAMVITNKRAYLKQPLKFIHLDSNRVEMVNNFKLLGVTLDTKLNFDAYSAMLAKSINIRLFSIKRLFYLPFI